MKNQALVVLYPGCIEFEIMLAAQLLAPYLQVRAATLDGADYAGSNGMTIRPQTSLAAVQNEEFAAILVPGGDPRAAIGCVPLINVLRKAAKGGECVIAAICAGPLLLGEAGVLNGRRVAHGYQRNQFDAIAQYFEGAKMTERPLEVDGKIVTAKPNAFVDFAIAIAVGTGVLHGLRRAEFLRRYYHGQNPGMHLLSGVTSVNVYVNDVYESMGWYEKVFGVTAESTDARIGILRVGHQEVVFCQSDHRSKPSTGGSLVNWWAENVEKTVDRVKSLGGEVFRGPTELNDGRVVYQILDPFGNVFGIEGFP